MCALSSLKYNLDLLPSMRVIFNIIGRKLMKKFITTFNAIVFCTLFISAITFGATATVSYTGMTSVTCPAVPVATVAPAVTGLTFTQLSRGSGVTCASATTGISGSGFNVPLATAITGSKWYAFSITSDALTTFTVDALSIVSQISSVTGTPSVSVQYSIGGASPTTTIGSFTPTTTSTVFPFTTSVAVGASQTITIYVIPNTLTASTTTARVNNATSVTVTTSSTLDITTPNVMTNGMVGTPYNTNFTSTSGVGPYTYSIASGTFPTGLTLNPDGTSTGSPTAAATYIFDITVTDSNPFAFIGNAFGNKLNPSSPNVANTKTETFRIKVLAIPTAAAATIRGRIVNESGRGLSRAVIALSNTQTGVTVYARTNQLGYFTVADLAVGDFYILQAQRKGYNFPEATSFQLFEDLDGLVIAGTPNQ
jgi:Carboxypeptidase regulatory-like domain